MFANLANTWGPFTPVEDSGSERYKNSDRPAWILYETGRRAPPLSSAVAGSRSKCNDEGTTDAYYRGD
jgi:hypothetical protein